MSHTSNIVNIVNTTDVNAYTASEKAIPANHATLISLGERVRALRARRALTRKSLALTAGVSERHLANLESGHGNASVLVLDAVAMALGCSLAELMGDETTTSPEWLLLRELLQGKNDAQIKQARLTLLSLFNETSTVSSSQIALVGLRGAGKSTLGKALAQVLNFEFIELNSVIEHLAGCEIAQIHANFGANAYRRYERRALEISLDSRPKVVIATPGGLVSDTAALAVLLKRCTTIWLQASAEEHMSRVLAQGDKRPMKGNREAMLDLRRILLEREAFYAKADYSFNTSGKSIMDSVSGLQNLLTLTTTNDN